MPLVHKVTVGRRHEFLDARLTAGEHEFLEFPVRCDQHVRRGRFECDTAFGADDGIAQMNAPSDAEGGGQCLQCFDERDGI